MTCWSPSVAGVGVAICGIIVSLVMAACDSLSRSEASVLPLAENRAYSGAPPVVDHEVMELGRGDCLSCHLRGDAQDSLKKKAPITPHPELVRCEQCHVEELTTADFKGSSYLGQTYTIGQKAYPGGPPHIPHPLTLRENCAGCHGPQGNDGLIRTDHPERVRCVQCHLQASADFPGPRPDLKPTPSRGGGLPNWAL